MLKFYNREKETALLKEIEQRSQESAQMTFVVGRRRVGKTALLNKTFEKVKMKLILSLPTRWNDDLCFMK